MAGTLRDPGPEISDDEIREWAPPSDGSPVTGTPIAGGPPLEYPPEPEPEIDPNVFWRPEQLRELLGIQGSALNALLGAGSPDAWAYTKADLDVIAPALCRIANRYPISRAAAAQGDEIVLVAALGKYGIRSMLQRGRAIAAREAEAAGGEPLAGRSFATVEPDGTVTPAGARTTNVWGEPNE